MSGVATSVQGTETTMMLEEAAGSSTMTALGGHVGPSSPSFAQATLWDGCIDRFHQEAEDRAMHLARENEQARKDLIDKLQQVMRMCREATMNINVALTPMDRLADEFGSKVKIEKPAAHLQVQKKIEKSAHRHQPQRHRTGGGGPLARFLATRDVADEGRWN